MESQDDPNASARSLLLFPRCSSQHATGHQRVPRISSPEATRSRLCILPSKKCTQQALPQRPKLRSWKFSGFHQVMLTCTKAFRTWVWAGLGIRHGSCGDFELLESIPSALLETCRGVCLGKVSPRNADIFGSCSEATPQKKSIFEFCTFTAWFSWALRAALMPNTYTKTLRVARMDF